MLVQRVTGTAPLPPTGYAPGPFGFADPAFTAALLTEAGWTVDDPEPIDFAYVAGEGTEPVADAAAFFRRIGPVSAALRAAPDAEHPALLDRLAAALAEHRTGDRVTFPAAAWIWRAHA